MEHYGVISIVPAASVLVLALITKRSFESLIGGTLIGFLIVGKTDFYSKFADSALKVMADPTIGWIILVCGLFGSLIAILVRSGGALAFGDAVEKYAKGKKSSLIVTWLMGLIIFIDDYLNALTVSSAMRRVTDKYKTSREMLSYVVDSTGAPVCVLIPFSTWAIFVSGLLETSGAAEKGAGLSVYISSVPYMMYAWVAVLLVPLVALGIVPRLGLMKQAEERAETTGVVIPPGSEGEGIVAEEIAEAAKESPKLYNFLVPILVMIFFTWYFSVDAFKGVLIATGFAVVLFKVQGLMNMGEIMDSFFNGFKSMIYPLAIVVASFMLKEVNDALGLTNYVIETVKPLMNASMLPVVVFLSLSVITFTTGSFWGVYAIALPIVIPLALAMDASLPVSIGAVVSAGALGSHACFYGDSTVLASAGCGCSNVDHALTQLPYAIISAVIASALFLVLGIAV